MGLVTDETTAERQFEKASEAIENFEKGGDGDGVYHVKTNDVGLTCDDMDDAFTVRLLQSWGAPGGVAHVVKLYDDK